MIIIAAPNMQRRHNIDVSTTIFYSNYSNAETYFNMKNAARMYIATDNCL